MAWFRPFSWARSVHWSHRSERRDGYGLADHVELDQAEFQLSVANVRAFKSRELIVATDKYNQGRVLGEGRSGHVYKGILNDGQEVAVKRFNRQADLWEEVRVLSRVEHSNLVKMIGYCDNRKDHIIVYEYMPLRSLNLHLHDLQFGKKPSLEWKTRMKIAEGVAKALEYLHNQKDPQLIYGGLKTTGILLDENYNPKLSDFGCVNHVATTSYDVIEAKFTLGYVAPEYAMTGKLILESDIYSFGVVMLELISGQKAIESTRARKECSIVPWARTLVRDSKKIPEMADPLMRGKYPYRGLVRALCLAIMCVQEKPHERPLITEVVTTLSDLVSQVYEEERGITEAGPSTPSTMHDA